MPDTPPSPDPIPPETGADAPTDPPPVGRSGRDRGGPGPRRDGRTRRPGLREQLSITIETGRRMVDAHVALAKAELEPIIDNVKAVAIQASLAIGAGLFAALLLAIGLPLFFGEWLFGSMGWGILHGLLGAIAVIAACVSLILVADARSIGLDAFLALVVGVLLSIVFGLSLTNQGWQALTDQLNLGLPVEWRLIGVAAGVSAIVGAILGAIVGAWRGGGRSMVDGLVFGTLIGLLVGLSTAISYGWQTGIAMGISGALVAFSALVLGRLAAGGVDMEAFKARFYPEQTIVTTKETLEWLQEQAPTGPKP